MTEKKLVATLSGIVQELRRHHYISKDKLEFNVSRGAAWQGVTRQDVEEVLSSPIVKILRTRHDTEKGN